MKLKNHKSIVLLVLVVILIITMVAFFFVRVEERKLPDIRRSVFGDKMKAIKNIDPVFSANEDKNKWDSNKHVAGNCMVKNEQNDTFLFYYANTKNGSEVGLAKKQGSKFERQGEPVLSPGKGDEWDNGSVSVYPGCITKRRDGTYTMFYSGVKKGPPDFYWDGAGAIGAAFSKDLIHWTKYEKNPVLTNSENIPWESEGIFEPSVVFSGDEFGSTDTYKMWYGGNDKEGHMSIGYAESHDGLTWIKHQSNPVLKKSENPNDFDGYTIEVHDVKKFNNGYIIAYEATDRKFPSHFRIGFAFSRDGIQWEKSDNNPILEEGDVGSWDSFGTYHPALVFEGDRILMYYVGLNYEYEHQIGLTEINPSYIYNK